MSSTIMRVCGCIMVHMEIAMDTAPTPTAQIRSIVAAALSESGMGQRSLEAARSLPAWSLRGIMDPSREQSPSVDRAAEIAAALGYELVIRPRGAAAPEATTSVISPRHDGGSDAPATPDRTAPPPPPAPGVAFEPVPDRRIAEVLAVLADEWEAADARTREALLIRFWHAYPDLRERAAARAGRRLARLEGRRGRA